MDWFGVAIGYHSWYSMHEIIFLHCDLANVFSITCDFCFVLHVYFSGTLKCGKC